MEIRDLKENEYYLIDNKNKVSFLKILGKTIHGGCVFNFNGKTFVDDRYNESITGYILCLKINEDGGYELNTINTIQVSSLFEKNGVYRIISNKKALDAHLEKVTPKMGSEDDGETNYVIDTSLGIFYSSYGKWKRKPKKSVFVYHTLEDAKKAARKAQNVIINNIDNTLKKTNHELEGYLMKYDDVSKNIVEIKDIKVNETYKVFSNYNVFIVKVDKIDGAIIYTNKGIIPLMGGNVRGLIFFKNDKKETKDDIYHLGCNYINIKNRILEINNRQTEIKELKKTLSEKNAFIDMPFNVKFYSFNDGVAEALSEVERTPIGILKLN